MTKQLNLEVPKEIQCKVETKGTSTFQAYDLYKKGLFHPDRIPISLDPKSASAYAYSAINTGFEMICNLAALLSDEQLQVLKDDASSYAELSQKLNPDGAHGFLSEAIPLNWERFFQKR